ncbi:MAG: alpha-amylase family glycosyl hydrolase [Desulfurococcus sp.]|nr:alpha-amylase family glycosyl hydrolase [Desulfurococcus sp.]
MVVRLIPGFTGVDELYKILGRSTIGRGRLGKYLVEYSLPWPREARRVYLIGVFSGWFPGHLRLSREGSRGRIILKLWPGVYPYGYSIEGRDIIPDPENNEIIEVRPFYDWHGVFKLSKSIVKPSDNPLEEVVHDEGDEAFLHRFLDTLVVRIRTPRLIEEPRLVAWRGEEFKAATSYAFEDTIIYEYHLPFIENNVYSYRFLVRFHGEEYYYGDEGVGYNTSPIIVHSRSIPGADRLEWYMGTVYYQIFPDSFDNGDPGNDPPTRITRTAPREHGYYGGDLQGIIRRVDHIADLGVEALYLTPIFQAGSYHRYDISDFTSIDRYLGTINDFDELVRRLHERNIKVVLDITLHHTGVCFPMFIKALEEGPGSASWSWYLFRDTPSREDLHRVSRLLKEACRTMDYRVLGELLRELREKYSSPFYESFFNLWHMPKLNHENPEVLEYFTNITRFWVERGVDGFRIDVAMGIYHAWLKLYYEKIKSIYREFLLLGELNDYPVYYAEYFDSSMDYYWRKILLEKIIDENLPTTKMLEALAVEYGELPHYKSISLYHTLGTHDTPRIMSYVKGDIGKIKLLYALLFTLPGSPAVYYGDEIGMEGGRDPDNRRPMEWARDKWVIEVYSFVRRMIAIYKAWKPLRHGFYKALVINDDVILVRRWFKNEEVYLIANLSEEKKTVRIEGVKGRFTNLLTGETIDVEDELNVELGRYGFLLLGRDSG